MSVLQYAMDSPRNLILNKDDNCINSFLFHHFFTQRKRTNMLANIYQKYDCRIQRWL